MRVNQVVQRQKKQHGSGRETELKETLNQIVLFFPDVPELPGRVAAGTLRTGGICLIPVSVISATGIGAGVKYPAVFQIRLTYFLFCSGLCRNQNNGQYRRQTEKCRQKKLSRVCKVKIMFQIILIDD